MLSAVVGVLGLGAGMTLVLWGALVRRTMERDGVLHGAGLMPAGAAQDVA